MKIKRKHINFLDKYPAIQPVVNSEISVNNIIFYNHVAKLQDFAAFTPELLGTLSGPQTGKEEG